MLKRQTKLITAFCSTWILVVLSGCGGRQNEQKFKTPADVLAASVKAINTDDRALFMSCFSGEHEKSIGAFFEFMSAGVKFRNAFLKKYDREKWEVFQGKKGARIDISYASLPEKDIREMKVSIKGDRAEGFVGGSSEPTRFVKVNGSWKIDARAMVPASRKAEDFQKMFSGTADVINRYAEKLDSMSISAEELDKKMGEDIFRAMFNLMKK